MAYSVQTLLTDLGSVLHGTTTNKVPNIYGHISRAASAVLLDVDPKETQRIVTLGQVFNDVFDYAAPVDLKGDRIIDLRLQAGRLPGEEFNQTYGVDFDANKAWSWDNKIYTQWNTGVKSLRIQAPWLTSPVVLTDTSSLTGWAATTGAQNLSLDTQNYVAGGGALTFDLAASSTSGYIETSSLSAVDFTNYLNLAYGFVWAYFPAASSITSVNVRWGTDSSNYYNLTVTTTQQGTAFQTGWNLLALPWASATKVGSPTTSSFKYVRFTVNYDSTLQTGVKFCNLTFALGSYFQAVYYSKYLFRDPSTNAFQERVTDSTDNGKLINLDTEAWPLLFNKTAYFIAQALQGADADYDATFWQNEYTNALARYRAQNPSEALVKAAVYYRPGQKSFRRYGGPGIYPN